MTTEIHIFYHHLDASVLQASLEQTLSQVPNYLHTRALRYQDKLSALNFIQGRLLLSHGLQHLGLEVDVQQLDYYENGKPFLYGAEFNISHSESWAVCAFSSHGTVGIDIERTSQKHIPHLQQNFTQKEWEDIQSDPNHPSLFYRLWCRKESVIKASGKTLADLHRLHLDSLSSRFKLDAEDWHLQDISFADALFAAICTRYPAEEVHLLPAPIQL